MCLCTPNIRTPFCGKPGCQWPETKCPKCIEGLHAQCSGVNCSCKCYGPAPNFSFKEALFMIKKKIEQCPEVIREVRISLPEDDERRIKLLSIEVMINMALMDAIRAVEQNENG